MDSRNFTPGDTVPGDPQAGINIQIAHDDKQNVIVNFGMQVTWLSMPAAEAVNFALAVLGHAGAHIAVNVDDAMIERAQEFQRREPALSGAEYTRAFLQFAINGTGDPQ